MKKVLFVYDDISHEKKLHNLFSFDQSNLYEYEDIFIRETEDIYRLFVNTKPDIIIINVIFDDDEVFDVINRIYNIKKEDDKIIIISASADLRDQLFKSKVPDRIFPSNVANDILLYTINEFINPFVINDNNIFVNLIDKLELKPFSPITSHFICSLRVSLNNPYLLGGHINNIFYSVSKRCDIATETARKSVYKVIENAMISNNSDYIHSIFGTNDLNDISPSRFLEMIVWKLRE